MGGQRGWGQMEGVRIERVSDLCVGMAISVDPFENASVVSGLAFWGLGAWLGSGRRAWSHVEEGGLVARG